MERLFTLPQLKPPRFPSPLSLYLRFQVAELAWHVNLLSLSPPHPTYCPRMAPSHQFSQEFPLFSFTSQLFCVFACRRPRAHQDISHSRPETCCLCAHVTPTLILVMMWTAVWISAHLLPMCESDRPPWPLASLSFVISSTFSSLYSHVCITAPVCDSYCPTQATSILIIYSALFDAEYLAAKPMCEAQQTESVVKRSAALSDVWAAHRVFVFRHISKNVRQATSLVLIKIFWKHSGYSEDKVYIELFHTLTSPSVPM